MYRIDSSPTLASLADASVPKGSEPKPASTVQSCVADLCGIQKESEIIRERLIRQGVTSQVLNVLVEMGVHDKLEEQAKLVATAVSASAGNLGVGGIDRQDLTQQLALLVSLEKDVAEVRRLAKSQEIDLPVVNALVRFILNNPEDGGSKAVTTFLAYSQVCNIKVLGVADLSKAVEEQRQSVLPEIQRAQFIQEGRPSLILLREIAVAVLIGIGVMWMVV